MNCISNYSDERKEIEIEEPGIEIQFQKHQKDNKKANVELSTNTKPYILTNKWTITNNIGIYDEHTVLIGGHAL